MLYSQQHAKPHVQHTHKRHLTPLVRGTSENRNPHVNRFVSETVRRIVARYGFSEKLAVPILQNVDIVHRSLGEQSDLKNSLYHVSDTTILRPDNTASTILGALRRFGVNKNLNPVKNRYFYYGPMFRRETRQRGRLCEFYQCGVEQLGSGEYYVDSMLIEMGAHVLQELGLLDSVQLELNTIGNDEARRSYQNAFASYLEGKSLTSENLRRLRNGNIWRIIDSHHPSHPDAHVISEAPLLHSFLSDSSLSRFNKILSSISSLSSSGLRVTHNPRLVRGLPYYSETVWEFSCTSSVLPYSQSTVLAGGRYDGLIEKLGGIERHGIGWACGVERLALLLEKTDVSIPRIPRVSIIPAPSKFCCALSLAKTLRKSSLLTMEIEFMVLCKNSLSRSLEQAYEDKFDLAVLLLEDDSDTVCTIKVLDTGEQEKVDIQKVDSKLCSLLETEKN